MNRSKWFVFVAALVASSAGAIIFAGGDEAEEINVECVDCQEQVIPLTAEGLPDQAAAAAADARAKQIKHRRAEEVRQRALQRFNTWRGTQGHVPENLPDDARPLYGAVAQIFGSDLPVPEDRAREFAPFIEGKPEHKCVGWSVKVMSVTPAENGWEATVSVRPELAAEDGGAYFTSQTTVEKWHIADDGTATVLDVQPGAGLGLLMRD